MLAKFCQRDLPLELGVSLDKIVFAQELICLSGVNGVSE